MGAMAHPALHALTIQAASNVCRTLHFDISQTAGFYSILAGLLSGFAFTTLILLTINRLDRPSSGDEALVRGRFANVQQVLAAAFIGLVLMSLAYAVAAGETKASGRSASEEPVLGVGFALSGLLLVYSIILTLDAVYSFAPAEFSSQSGDNGKDEGRALMRSGSSGALFMRDTLGRLVTLLAVLYVYLGVSDYETIRYWRQSSVHAMDIFIYALLFVQLIGSAFLYPKWTGGRKRAPRAHSADRSATQAVETAPERSDKSAPLLSKVSIFIIFLCVVWFAFYDSHGNLCSTVSPIVPTAAFLIMSTSTMFFTYQLAYSRPAPIDPWIAKDSLKGLCRKGMAIGSRIHEWLERFKQHLDTADVESDPPTDAE